MPQALAADSLNENQLTIDSMLTSVIVIDDLWYIRRLNSAAENLLGIGRRQAIGRSFMTLINDDAELAHILSRATATGEPFTSELRLSPGRAHRLERIVDCRVSLIADKRLLLELADVTRRVRMNQDFSRLAQHEAGRQMIRQLAHEVGNPLGGLRGAAQLLARELDDPCLHEYTEIIIKEADRLKALIDNLLIPGRRTRRGEVDLGEVINHVGKMIEAEFPRLQVQRQLHPSLPSLWLDRDQIVQAALNLLRNAAQAIDGQGTIWMRLHTLRNVTIGMTEHRHAVSIEIEDHGPGVPAHLEESLFYPLVTDSDQGTGLGLPLAQELVHRHGGLIQFRSRPGCTVFQIRLPMVVPNG